MARIAHTRQGQKLSFTDFLAYQTILNNIPSLCTTIATSADIKVRSQWLNNLLVCLHATDLPHVSRPAFPCSLVL